MNQNLEFHHIGVACHDIEQTKAFYTECLGYAATETVEDPIQDIRICFLEKSDAPRIELLAPVDENSPVNRTLAAVGVSPYHICYTVADIELTVKELRRQQKFVLVAKPVPACALQNKRVAFLYKKEVGLIELLEA